MDAFHAINQQYSTNIAFRQNRGAPLAAAWGKAPMKDSLRPGLKYQHKLLLRRDKMVPALYPEAEEFQEMPEVFATGFMVGFLEWACLKAVLPHIDWPREQTVGTHVNFSHQAASPAGLWVTARVELVGVDGRRLSFTAEADDGIDTIARGSHERFVIDREKFDQRLAAKLASID